MEEIFPAPVLSNKYHTNKTSLLQSRGEESMTDYLIIVPVFLPCCPCPPAPALLTGRENEPPIKGQVPRLFRGKRQFIFVRIWPTKRWRKGCSERFDRVVSHLRGVNDYSRYDEHAVYDGECPEQSVKAVSHLRRWEDPASENFIIEYWS